MSRFLKIAVENPADELASFPLTQNIRLISSEVIEDSLLESKITLLRNVRESGLLHNSDLYNYNIGFVKEKFSTVPIKIKLDQNKIIINPVDALNPGSSYTLFVDKHLSKEYITIEKIVSKSNSKLELLIDDHQTDEESSNTYKLTVISDPLITAKSNIVKLQLYVNGTKDKLFTIDAKSSKNTISFYGFTVKVFDTAYGKGEEFELVTEEVKFNLEDNLIVNINTVLNTEIQPADNANVSKVLSHDDIVDFYNNKKVIKDETTSLSQEDVDKDITLEYVGYNKVLLHLNKLVVEQLDFKNMDMIEFPAYNRYDLECMGLYNSCQLYYIDYKVIDDKTVLLEFKEYTE